MALLPILHYPDLRLHTKAKPVGTVDSRIRKLAADMAETMYAAPGIGLAATQDLVKFGIGVIGDMVPSDIIPPPSHAGLAKKLDFVCFGIVFDAVGKAFNKVIVTLSFLPESSWATKG